MLIQSYAAAGVGGVTDRIVDFFRQQPFPLNGLIGAAVAVSLFVYWNWRRHHRKPKFRNSGDTAKENPLLDGRRHEDRQNRPAVWGTIRVWNPSEDSVVIEPTLLLHRMFFKRTSKLERYLDTIELGPREDAEFQIEILREVVPADFRPLKVEFTSSNLWWCKVTVTFDFARSASQ